MRSVFDGARESICWACLSWCSASSSQARAATEGLRSPPVRTLAGEWTDWPPTRAYEAIDFPGGCRLIMPAAFRASCVLRERLRLPLPSPPAEKATACQE
jgi:hypothetical protein